MSVKLIEIRKDVDYDLTVDGDVIGRVFRGYWKIGRVETVGWSCTGREGQKVGTRDEAAQRLYADHAERG